MSVALALTSPPHGQPTPRGRAWTYFPNAFSLLVIGFLALNYFSAFADLDFSWQVRTGERIVRTGQLLPTEGFTYTVPGRTASQFEWLYEVILWLVWNTFGFGGLKLLRTLLVATPLVLLALRLRREGVRWHAVVLSLAAAVLVVAPAWNLRPMYCTTIGLLVVSSWLHDHCTGRRPLTWWLPVVMLAWSNLHPGVITGQGLLLGAMAWEWLNRWVRLNKPLEQAALWRLTWIGTAGLAATLISPAPLARLQLVFQPQLTHPIQHIFAEMRPLPALLLEAPYLLALTYVVAAVVGVTLVLRFREYRLWEVALLAGLAFLANLAIRCVQDWLLVMLALGVPHLAVLTRRLRVRVRAWRRERTLLGKRSASIGLSLAQAVLRVNRSCRHTCNSWLMRFQWRWSAVALALLAALSLVPVVSRQMPVQDAKDWPAPALDWVEAHGLGGKFFAPPDYGSYLTWRLGDHGKCYVDTRGFIYPPELLEDSHYVPQMGPQWHERLERILVQKPDYFLLETNGPRGLLWRSLQSHVGYPLYLDGQTVLLSGDQVRQGLHAMDHFCDLPLGAAVALLDEPAHAETPGD